MVQSGTKAGELMVSGGVDEHIRMYNMRRRAEVGELLYHKGTISRLVFIGSSHLLSASEDGTICIWRSANDDGVDDDHDDDHDDDDHDGSSSSARPTS
jgi:WD40 repeat protein